MDFIFSKEIGEKRYLLTCIVIYIEIGVGTNFEVERHTVNTVLICRN